MRASGFLSGRGPLCAKSALCGSLGTSRCFSGLWLSSRRLLHWLGAPGLKAGNFRWKAFDIWRLSEILALRMDLFFGWERPALGKDAS